MGQKCCSVTQNSPQIQVDEEETTKMNQQLSAAGANKLQEKEDKQQLQKRNFYGKDGEVHSRTITKEMPDSAELQFEQYKGKIFKDPSTIREETEESHDCPSNPSHSKLSKSRQSSIFSMYLEGLADQISGQARP